MTTITRRIEFDAGHRIPSHNSKCRHFHGHRYVLEATLGGDILPIREKSDDGMIVDFSCLKEVMVKWISDWWDHGFLVYKGDIEAIKALQCLPIDHKTIVLPVIPTVENLAEICYSKIYEGLIHCDEIKDNISITLEKVRLYETPNGWAEYSAGN